MEEKVIRHLKNAGFDDERIGMILSVIPIEEAYENLMKNEALKKADNGTGTKDVGEGNKG